MQLSQVVVNNIIIL